MAMKLEKENVHIALMSVLNNLGLYGAEGKEAEHITSYVAGVLDMANAIIEAIDDLGGK